MRKDDRSSSMDSVDRALQVMLLLADREQIGVTELARALGVAPSTAHRLLAALCRRGFAERVDPRGYRAGPALGSRRGRQAFDDQVRSAARPYLERLEGRLEETVHLIVRDGVHSSFIDCVECRQTLRVGSRVGRVLPAHCTSGGLAMLADLPDAELEALYPYGLPEWPTASIRDLATLQRRLELFREQGYATNHGDSERGVTAVGVSLRLASGQPCAAITVAAPEVRAGAAWVELTVEALTAAAAEVSPMLHRQPAGPDASGADAAV